MRHFFPNPDNQKLHINIWRHHGAGRVARQRSALVFHLSKPVFNDLLGFWHFCPFNWLFLPTFLVCKETLHGCLFSQHGCLVSLHGCLVTLHWCKKTLHGCLVALHGCKESLHGCSKTFLFCKEALHGCLVSLHGCKETYLICKVTLHGCWITLHRCLVSEQGCSKAAAAGKLIPSHRQIFHPAGRPANPPRFIRATPTTPGSPPTPQNCIRKLFRLSN